MSRSHFASIAGIAAVLRGVAVPAIAGWARPGYNHFAQYISELGEHGTALGGWVSLAGFLPTGVDRGGAPE